MEDQWKYNTSCTNLTNTDLQPSFENRATLSITNYR